jgi:hypothetical protein
MLSDSETLHTLYQGLFQDFLQEGIAANFKGGGGQSHIKYRESQFPRGGAKAPPELNPVVLQWIETMQYMYEAHC